MGKPSKRIKQTATPSVAILTPTTASRTHVLPLLAVCIRAQTYSNIKEWLLIDGSSDDDAIDKDALLASIADVPNCIIRWVPTPKLRSIGALRQALNDSMECDIAVCCDDDDYYPPTRVSHAVEKLIKSRAEIAGCTNHLVFDLDMGQSFQFRGFGPNHSTHNSMAYTKAFARRRRYDCSVSHAEEASFTDDFREPMVQLDYLHNVVHMIHSGNTFNKREHTMQGLTGTHCSVRLWRGKPVVPKQYIDAYTSLLSPDSDEDTADIVYYLGGWNAYKWKPTDTSLGGSEQAVVELSSNWAKMGFSVTVYGDFDPCEIDGVTYRDWKTFKFQQTYKNLILWRLYGSFPLRLVPRLRAKRLILDLHDNHLRGFGADAATLANAFDCIAVKSEYHQRSLSFTKKVSIVPNGIRDSMFLPSELTRDCRRCVWASDYARGLQNILRYAWPAIREQEPEATFHVYYGMQGHPPEFQAAMRPLLRQPGVHEHGRCSAADVAAEKQRSAFHLYFSASTAEIDCISIRESVTAGCIPVLSTYNVFAERPGVHVEGDPNTREGCERFAAATVALMRDSDKVREIAKQMRNVEVLNWTSVAHTWRQQLLSVSSPSPPPPLPLPPTLPKAFVVNLDRRPDRMAKFEARCPLQWERLSAVDGRSLTCGRGLRMAEIACALSHLSVWQRILSDDLPAALVFEDDAYFVGGFTDMLTAVVCDLPADFDMCYIGGRFNDTFRCHEESYERIANSLLRYSWRVPHESAQHDRTTHAYIISKRGAQFLVDSFPKVFPKPLDHWMLQQMRQSDRDVYSADPLIAWSPLHGDSDIR